MQGVILRKIKGSTEHMCGTEISVAQVFRAISQLGANLQEWLKCSLSEIRFLYLDTRYEKLRDAGHIRDAVVVIATSISPDGNCQVLELSVSLSEQEAHWRVFLQELKSCGLWGVQLITHAPALQVLVAMITMPSSASLGARCMAVSPGSAPSSTCGKMPVLTCHGSRFECKRLPRSALSSLALTGNVPRSCCGQPSRGIPSQPLNCRLGWRRTW